MNTSLRASGSRHPAGLGRAVLIGSDHFYRFTRKEVCRARNDAGINQLFIKQSDSNPIYIAIADASILASLRNHFEGSPGHVHAKRRVLQVRGDPNADGGMAGPDSGI